MSYAAAVAGPNGHSESPLKWRVYNPLTSGEFDVGTIVALDLQQIVTSSATESLYTARAVAAATDENGIFGIVVDDPLVAQGWSNVVVWGRCTARVGTSNASGATSRGGTANAVVTNLFLKATSGKSYLDIVQTPEGAGTTAYVEAQPATSLQASSGTLAADEYELLEVFFDGFLVSRVRTITVA